MRPADRLFFDRRVPLRLNKVYSISYSQREAITALVYSLFSVLVGTTQANACNMGVSPNRASLDRHEQDADRRILFEPLQAFFALGCANTTVNLQAHNSSALQYSL